MQSLQTVKPKVTQLLNKKGELSEADQEAAEVLCEFFQKVFVMDKDDSGDIQLVEREMEEIPMCFHRDKVKDMLLSLKMDKSPGPDSIHPMVLQRSADELSLPSRLYSSAFFGTGHVPADWKLAVVVQSSRKGEKSDLGHSVSNQPEVETQPSQIFTQKLSYALQCVLSIHAKFQFSILYTCWDNELFTGVVSTRSWILWWLMA